MRQRNFTAFYLLTKELMLLEIFCWSKLGRKLNWIEILHVPTRVKDSVINDFNSNAN